MKASALLNTNDAKYWNDFCNYSLPTQKNELWKYAELDFLRELNFTLPKPNQYPKEYLQKMLEAARLNNLDSILLVCIDGKFAPEYSDLHLLPESMLVNNFNNVNASYQKIIKKNLRDIDATKHPFANLNAELMTDGLFIFVPDHLKVNTPIHLLSISTQSSTIANTTCLVILNAHSKLTLIEEFISLENTSHMSNHLAHVEVGTGAELQHYKLQNECKNAIHFDHMQIEQNENSITSFMNISVGGKFSRDDLIINLNGANAVANARGFYNLTQTQQYIDHHIDIRHYKENTQSDMLYKGLIKKAARAVFNGRVFVEKNAVKTFALQANHNLLLAKFAEIYSKPELEIYADDIQCKHAATTGQLDANSLFYLCSRGIDKLSATQLLLNGFAQEVLQYILLPEVKLKVQELLS